MTARIRVQRLPSQAALHVRMERIWNGQAGKSGKNCGWATVRITSA